MLQDPIADMLTRIRNGYLAGHKTVNFRYSKLNLAICKILAENGYAVSAETQGTAPAKQIKVTLKYDNRKPALTHIRRISKPGRRWYSPSKELPRPLNGLGLAIVTTPNGVITDKQARSKHVGGEVICIVW